MGASLSRRRLPAPTTAADAEGVTDASRISLVIAALIAAAAPVCFVGLNAHVRAGRSAPRYSQATLPVGLDLPGVVLLDLDRIPGGTRVPPDDPRAIVMTVKDWRMLCIVRAQPVEVRSTSQSSNRNLESSARVAAIDRVDAGGRRCCDGLVSFGGELVDDLRADQPGAADDHELHGRILPVAPSMRWRSAVATGRARLGGRRRAIDSCQVA